MGEREARRLLDELIKNGIYEISAEEEKILRQYPDVWEDYILFKAFRRLDEKSENVSSNTSWWKEYLAQRRRSYKLWLFTGIGGIVLLVLLMFIFEPTVGYFYSHGMHPWKFYKWYFGGGGGKGCGGLFHLAFYLHFIVPFLVIGLIVFAIVMLIKAVRF